MRLAEAIRLGSLVLKPVAGTTNDGKGGGCALGMAWKATSTANEFVGAEPCRARCVEVQGGTQATRVNPALSVPQGSMLQLDLDRTRKNEPTRSDATAPKP